MTKRKSTSSHEKTPALPFCKVCNLEDFDNPVLKPALLDMYPGAFEYAIQMDDDTGEGEVTDEQTIPMERRRRKLWETAMAVTGLREQGALRPDVRLLGVGAGREWTSFYLTRHVEQVFMADLYAAKGTAWQNAIPEMLIKPSSPFAGDWDPYRMVVQHMDARDLRYPSDFFDGIFSSSAIEHFGKMDDIAQAAAEMGRVLKPGGVLTLATEWKIEGDTNGWPGVVLFDAGTIQQYIVEPSGCDLVGDLDASISEATRDTQQTLSKATANAKVFDRPHIVFVNKGFVFTSVFLTLVKPG